MKSVIEYLEHDLLIYFIYKQWKKFWTIYWSVIRSISTKIFKMVIKTNCWVEVICGCSHKITSLQTTQTYSCARNPGCRACRKGMILYQILWSSMQLRSRSFANLFYIWGMILLRGHVWLADNPSLAPKVLRSRLPRK